MARKCEKKVRCLSLERFSELQTLHYASRTAADSAKHQNWVFTGWANEYLLLLHPLYHVAANPMTLLSTDKDWAML